MHVIFCYLFPDERVTSPTSPASFANKTVSMIVRVRILKVFWRSLDTTPVAMLTKPPASNNRIILENEYHMS